MKSNDCRDHLSAPTASSADVVLVVDDQLRVLLPLAGGRLAVGDDFAARLKPETVDRLWETMRRQGTGDGRSALHLPEGEQVFDCALLQIERLPDEDGHSRYLLFLRQRAGPTPGDHLRDSRSREAALSLLIESASEAIFSIDADGVFLFMNPAAARALGSSPDQVIGRTMWELFPRETADRQMATVREVIRTGEPYMGERETIVGGQSRWYHTSIVRAESDHGPVALLISRDMTQQRRAESALERSEERFRSLAESVHDVIYTLSPEGVVTYVSPQIRRYGLKPESIVGRHFLEFIAPDDRQRVIDDFKASMAGQKLSDPSQLRIIDAQGREVWFEEAGQTVYGPDGRPAGQNGILRDITERRVLESQLVRSERLAAMGTLAGGVAHEFNNINATILGFVELALTQELDAEVRDWLERILRASRRARHITQNLLAFSRARRVPDEFANLVHVATDTVDMVFRRLQDDDIELDLRLHHVPDTRMNPAEIGQILLNLLLNAQQSLAGRQTRRITIETGQRDGEIFAAVVDTGCGIPQGELETIFQPFYTTKDPARRGTDAAGGTGLGLSVSRTIIEHHGGRLTVDSTPGEGSRFTLWLPLISQSPPAPEASPAVLAESRPDGARVLVLDDEKDTRELLTLLLTREGMHPASACDGETALHLLASQPHDLLILDLEMPGLSGLEVLERVHQLPHDHQPACLVITGRPREDLLERCSKLGVEVLPKPFDLNDLLRHVRELLQSS